MPKAVIPAIGRTCHGVDFHEYGCRWSLRQTLRSGEGGADESIWSEHGHGSSLAVIWILFSSMFANTSAE